MLSGEDWLAGAQGSLGGNCPLLKLSTMQLRKMVERFHEAKNYGVFCTSKGATELEMQGSMSLPVLQGVAFNDELVHVPSKE